MILIEKRSYYRLLICCLTLFICSSIFVVNAGSADSKIDCAILPVKPVEVMDGVFNGETVLVPVYGDYGHIVQYIRVNLYDITSWYDLDGRFYLEDVYSALKIFGAANISIPAALAQAYTEGGRGVTGIYIHSNNCFGIRADANWLGLVYSNITNKVYLNRNFAVLDGATDLFRAYYSLENSVDDYCLLITTAERYQAALDAEPYEYLKALLDNGYGEYYMLDTWMYVIDKFNLTEYS